MLNVTVRWLCALRKLHLTKTHMRRWLVGGLRSEGSEAAETKQAASTTARPS